MQWIVNTKGKICETFQKKICSRIYVDTGINNAFTACIIFVVVFVFFSTNWVWQNDIK